MQDKPSFIHNQYVSILYLLLFVFVGCRTQPKETIGQQGEMSTNNLHGVRFKLDYPMDEEKILLSVQKNYKPYHTANHLVKVVIVNDTTERIYINHAVNPPYFVPVKYIAYSGGKIVEARDRGCLLFTHTTTCLHPGDSLVQFFPLSLNRQTEKIAFTFEYYLDSLLAQKQKKAITYPITERVVKVIKP
jgi:hypothetical protein